jgi:hypothetical protein
MTGNFPIPEFNTSYTITHRNFVRIRDKIFFEKSMNPTFYRICTPKKHLNCHSSLIKPNTTMNSTPLDSYFLLLARKNFTSLFSFKRNSQKISYFWLPHQQLGFMTGNFPMPVFNTSYTITHRNFVRIRDKKFF